MFVVGIFTFVSTKFTWFEILPSNSTINHRSPSPGTWGIPSPGTNLRNSRDRGAFRETTNLLWGQVPIKFPQEFCNRRVFHFTKIVYFLRVVFEKTFENQMKGTTKKGWFVDVFPVSRKTCFLERQLAPSLMSDASLFFWSVPARKNGSIQWFGLGRKSQSLIGPYELKLNGVLTGATRIWETFESQNYMLKWQILHFLTWKISHQLLQYF